MLPAGFQEDGPPWLLTLNPSREVNPHGQFGVSRNKGVPVRGTYYDKDDGALGYNGGSFSSSPRFCCGPTLSLGSPDH